MKKTGLLLLLFSAVWVFGACAPQKIVDEGGERSAAFQPVSSGEGLSSELETATFALG
jgi:hypothetical protein